MRYELYLLVMKNHGTDMVAELSAGNFKALARAITMVENELKGYDDLLLNLKGGHEIPIIGITGPPGAGKSTLVNHLINELLGKTSSKSRGVAVISVDPSSPMHSGAILGDRLRMKEHFDNTRVFIRSLATRGALGGLSAKTIEVSELMRAFGFGYIVIETVGVGQSEVEIAGLADITVLVLTPESGDDIQVMKSGIIEIADIYVVNKSDREGSDEFVKNLMLSIPLAAQNTKVPVIKTVATENNGIEKLSEQIIGQLKKKSAGDQSTLIAEKAYRLILNRKMKGIDKDKLRQEIEKALKKEKDINVYRFASEH